MSKKIRIMKSKVTANSEPAPTAYSEAVDHIQSAIQALSEAANNGDVIAKESIANLGVVMLDLK